MREADSQAGTAPASGAKEAALGRWHKVRGTSFPSTTGTGFPTKLPCPRPAGLAPLIGTTGTLTGAAQRPILQGGSTYNLWNSLPRDLKVPSLLSFQCPLRTFLLRQAWPDAQKPATSFNSVSSRFQLLGSLLVGHSCLWKTALRVS